MKVCAHFNLAPFHNVHERFDTLAEAKEYLQDHGSRDRYDDRSAVDIYPQCAECDSAMNFHDSPMARYELGPRGGIRKATV